MKIGVVVGIMLLLCNTVAPLAANALPLNSGSGDGMFLPIPRQLLPTSYHGMSTSMPDPNSIQVSPHSNITLTPIPHELSSRSHPSMNTSISNPNNSVQFLPSSNLNIRNGSDIHYYNNPGASSNRTPFGFWNPILAAAPFLNIPKNLIVPQTCFRDICTSCRKSINSSLLRGVVPSVIALLK